MYYYVIWSKLVSISDDMAAPIWNMYPTYDDSVFVMFLIVPPLAFSIDVMLGPLFLLELAKEL